MKTKSQLCLSVIAIVVIFTAGCRNIVIEGQFYLPAEATARAENALVGKLKRSPTDVVVWAFF